MLAPVEMSRQCEFSPAPCRSKGPDGRDQELWERQTQLWDREMTRWDRERAAWDAKESRLMEQILQMQSQISRLSSQMQAQSSPQTQSQTPALTLQPSESSSAPPSPPGPPPEIDPTNAQSQTSSDAPSQSAQHGDSSKTTPSQQLEVVTKQMQNAASILEQASQFLPPEDVPFQPTKPEEYQPLNVRRQCTRPLDSTMVVIIWKILNPQRTLKILSYHRLLCSPWMQHLSRLVPRMWPQFFQ